MLSTVTPGPQSCELVHVPRKANCSSNPSCPAPMAGWGGRVQQSWQRPGSLPSPQALKYAFQTHDRLCFVMEYANGGEVSRPARHPPFLRVSFPSENMARGEGGGGSLPAVSAVHPPAPQGRCRLPICRWGNGLRGVKGLVQVHTARELVGRVQTEAQGGVERGDSAAKRACASPALRALMSHSLSPDLVPHTSLSRADGRCSSLAHNCGFQPIWSQSCCHLLMTCVPLLSCCHFLIHCPLHVIRACFPLGACCQSFTLHPLLFFFSCGNSTRCPSLGPSRCRLPVYGAGVTSSLGRVPSFLPAPSFGSCSSTCPGSVSSRRSEPASTAQRSSQPWSTCTRGTWFTVTSR